MNGCRPLTSRLHPNFQHTATILPAQSSRQPPTADRSHACSFWRRCMLVAKRVEAKSTKSSAAFSNPTSAQGATQHLQLLTQLHAGQRVEALRRQRLCWFHIATHQVPHLWRCDFENHKPGPRFQAYSTVGSVKHILGPSQRPTTTATTLFVRKHATALSYGASAAHELPAPSQQLVSQMHCGPSDRSSVSSNPS